ncbi:MAG: glycosyl hydrolase [Candidatus Aminicenantes bacterium]|nr:glycosyl hydrolase [Candidatus Aminicenantes bacterium]
MFVSFCWIFVFLLSLTFLSYSKTKNPPDSGNNDPLASLSLNAFKLRSIGPALTSGRISDFAVNPKNPSEFYVASASGGVWKTINAGTTFTPIFDHQGSYSIGCITIDPNNTHIIWVGTGENNNQRSVAYGDGIYKSTDRGASWKHMGLKNSEHIGMIVVDPRNSDVVYAAACGPLWSAGGDRGLYKTTDSGETWTPILTISEHTGVNEVHLDPRNPDIIYAAAHQRRRHVFTLIDGGPESGLYKSKDAGKTWTKINKGLPSGDKGRIGLAISPADPDYLYAIVEAQRGQGGFFRSLNRGASWEKQSSYSSSGNYYQEIIGDPKDRDRVYSMDTFLQVTDDGGKTWEALGDRSKHWDSHALWIDPKNTSYYLNGNDGGVYESFDRGKTWKYMPNLPVTQFYKIAVDYDEPFYHVYGGTQDNYSLGGPSRTTSAHGIVNADWYTTQGGDGFESQVDPENPNIVYAQSQYGNLTRFDKKSGENLGIQPKPRKGEKSYRWNWDAPLLISPHSHTRLYFAANKLFRSDDRGNTWKVISDDLTQQIDRNKLKVMGKIWPMDAVAKNASTSPYGTIVALDESPVQEDMLYVGTDDGLIQVTEDGGETWRKIESFPGIPERTYVNDIIASHHERNTVFVAFNNHKNGDFKPYVLKSTDAGKTWTSLSADLPERGPVYALAHDHINKDLLFAGTEFGVFASLDGGKHWKPLKNGLPTIAVRDITIQKRESDLVLATFGRGIYILDDYSPIRHVTKEVLSQEGHIFPIKDALMFVEKTPLGTLGSRSKGFQGENYFTAPNPPVAATFTYYLKETIKTLEDKRREEERKKAKQDQPVYYPSYEQMKAEQEELTPYLIFTILDEEGREVRHLRAPARKGLNRINWDLRYPALNPTNVRNANPTSSGPSSTWVLPGTYQVILSKWEKGEITPLTEPVVFKAKTLGNTTLPAEDKAALVDFQKKVRKLSHSVNAASSVLRDLQARTTHYKVALKSVTVPHKELFSQIIDLEKKLEDIQRQMYGDSIKRRLDMDAEPGLSRRINSIIYEQWKSTSAPTQTQKDNYQIVVDQFSPIYEQLKTILEKDVKNIEQKLDQIGAPYTPGRLPDWK